MDVLHRVLQWIDHNRYKVAGLLLAIILSIGMIGCEPTMTSLINPKQKVTADVFEREVVAMDVDIGKMLIEYEAQGKKLELLVEQNNTTIEAGRQGFLEKLEFRRKFIQLGGGVVTSLITGNPIGIAETVASIMALTLTSVGTGAMVDSRRKDRVIKAKDERIKNPTTT